MRHWLVFIFSALVAFPFACTSPTGQREPDTSGLDLAAMDTTMRPQEDFFAYANGGWLSRTQIPLAESEWGAFRELTLQTEKKCFDLFIEASQSQTVALGTDLRKAIQFFERGMDSLQAEKLGTRPLAKAWRSIDDIKTKSDLLQYLIEQELNGESVFFTVEAAPRWDSSRFTGLFVSPAKLGLPDRDYYLRTDPRSREIKASYEAHVASMFRLAGVSETQARKESRAVVDYETFLAKGMLPLPERNHPQITYNRRSFGELNRLTPSLSWSAYLQGLGVKVDTVNVKEPAYLREVERSFATFSNESLKSFLRWTALRFAAPYLNNAIVQESFQFNQRYLNGVEQMAPRWQRVFREVNYYFGDAIGKLYVRSHFSDEVRLQATEIANHVRLAMADRIKESNWMTDTTKMHALAKLKGMTLKIGVPEKWKNYAGLALSSDTVNTSFCGDLMAARRYVVHLELAKVGQAVDRTEWSLSPQVVDFYYNTSFNELVVPAAALQPPFLQVEGDVAVNYGGIGTIIARQIARGFDANGRWFDEQGNFKNQWREEEARKVEGFGKAFAQQSGRHELLRRLTPQAANTAYEDLTYLGGVVVAFEGLQRELRERGSPGVIRGLTPSQRFFISWAAISRNLYRPNRLETIIRNGDELPVMVRVNGSLSNTDAFYNAFHLKPGDKMFLEERDRVRIW